MEKQELCPYCESPMEHCIPSVVYRHAESYGGSMVRFNCVQCGKVIKGFSKVTISVSGFQKTDEQSDWPHWKE